MQEARNWIPRGPVLRKLLFFQASDYDGVHVKTICKLCIVKFSVVNIYSLILSYSYNSQWAAILVNTCIWDPINNYCYYKCFPNRCESKYISPNFYFYFQTQILFYLFYLYILASDPLSNIFRESVNESRSSSLFQHWKHFQAVNL